MKPNVWQELDEGSEIARVELDALLAVDSAALVELLHDPEFEAFVAVTSEDFDRMFEAYTTGDNTMTPSAQLIQAPDLTLEEIQADLASHLAYLERFLTPGWKPRPHLSFAQRLEDIRTFSRRYDYGLDEPDFQRRIDAFTAAGGDLKHIEKPSEEEETAE